MPTAPPNDPKKPRKTPKQSSRRAPSHHDQPPGSGTGKHNLTDREPTDAELEDTVRSGEHPKATHMRNHRDPETGKDTRPRDPQGRLLPQDGQKGDKSSKSTRTRGPGKKKTKGPAVADLLLDEPDPQREGARLSKAGKVQWLERVLEADDVPFPSRMAAFTLHSRFTGDLAPEGSEHQGNGDGPDKEGATNSRLDPAFLMHRFAGYAGQPQGRFLSECGGLPHLIASICELARIHPSEIIAAAEHMIGPDDDVTLPALPLTGPDDSPPVPTEPPA